MNSTTNQSQKQEINFQPINAENLLNQHMTLTCEFNKSQMKCTELYKELEEERNKNEERRNKNGFQMYDIDNQPIFSKFGFNTYDEINLAIERDFKWNKTAIHLYVEVIKPNSVIIEFNGLALTFDIKGHNGDYHLEFVSVEDA